VRSEQGSTIWLMNDQRHQATLISRRRRPASSCLPAPCSCRRAASSIRFTSTWPDWPVICRPHAACRWSGPAFSRRSRSSQLRSSTSSLTGRATRAALSSSQLHVVLN